jgi:hypothetical protein
LPNGPISVLFATLTVISSGAQAGITKFPTHTNLFGQDCHSFNLIEGNPERCQHVCLDEERCQAWTCVEPGAQGQHAKGWLKDSVPPESADACCTSDVRIVAEAALDTETDDGANEITAAMPDNASEISPHMVIGDLEVTFSQVVQDHRPVEPIDVFSEEDNAIFVAFHNTGTNFLHADIDIYTVDVDGFEPDSAVWGGWVQIPGGLRHSAAFNAPDGGFMPGTYRVEVKVAGRESTAVVEVEPRFPLAEVIAADADVSDSYNLALAALGATVTA